MKVAIGDIRWLGIPIGRGTETGRNIKLIPVVRRPNCTQHPNHSYIEMRVASLTLLVASALTAVLAAPIVGPVPKWDNIQLTSVRSE